MNKILKKIEVPKTYQKINYFGIKKRVSPLPLSTRNCTSIITIYNNNNKNKDKDNNMEKRNTIWNENNLNSINNNINSNSQTIFKTYKKKDETKSIFSNANFPGPYTKPKCIYKDKKLNGILAKRLFNNLNELTNIENEKKNELQNND